MPKINQQLLGAIMDKTDLSRAQAYARIKQKASSELLPRHLAAIRVAADAGVTINKYASDEELAQLRNAGSPKPAPPRGGSSPAFAPTSGRSHKATTRRSARAPNSVFVVHGRDAEARSSIFAFLRAVGVKPIEWTSAIEMTKKASPYIGEILDSAFALCSCSLC